MASAPSRLEEDFQIVRRSFPDVARSVQSTSSSISTPKKFENERSGAAVSRAHEWSKDVLVRLERLESQQLQSQTALAERREESMALLAQLAELRSAPELVGLREQVESKWAQQQAALQAHAEQSRLQLSELRNEQAALRERQAARDGECASKIMELASCVDEVARQLQDMKQDRLTETTCLRLEANEQDGHMARLEALELQLREEQARSTTESAALKARLQALELRLAAAALERVSAQASSAHKAQEQLDMRLARLEAGFMEAKGLASLQGTTTAASGSVSAVSLASEEAKGGLAHLVGEMDAELRVELNARLRGLTADLKGEIMSDVAARLAAAEASVGCIEAKLSSELEHVCEDFKTCLESITKAQLVPRVKKVEEQLQSTKMLLATMHDAARGPEADVKMEKVREEAPKAEHVISNGLRQRLHGLVSALSYTLGQVHAEGEAEAGDGSTGSGPLSGSNRRAPQTERRQSGNPRQGLEEALPSPKEYPKVNRQFTMTPAARGQQNSQGRTPSGQSPQRQSVQVPVNYMAWPDGRNGIQGRQLNSMPASRGGSPPVMARPSLSRQPMSASASPFPQQARTPQIVLPQRPAAYRRA